MSFSRLLLPALRFPDAADAPDPFLRLAARGVGGFCVFGGDARLPDLLRRLREAAPHPLLVASDMEDGAGQQVSGLVRHPPAAALDPEAARASARLTALEARPLGITMTFAPVCDVASRPKNPILLARCFPDPPRCAPAFVEGARSLGLKTCAKHFPGHGATEEDSHEQLPVIADPAETWRTRDLPPFSACFSSGVDAVMTAHVACPALTGSPTLPATLSPRVMTDLLRKEMGFLGLAISDALLMEAVRQGRSEGEAARLAVDAGCDAVLCPQDVEAVLTALETVGRARGEEALARMAIAAE
ncbi:MAG: glycoside hydrolase family 3 N-terminal domain-containing protein, partial [Planctomycetota bacterium]